MCRALRGTGAALGICWGFRVPPGCETLNSVPHATWVPRTLVTLCSMYLGRAGVMCRALSGTGEALGMLGFESFAGLGNPNLNVTRNMGPPSALNTLPHVFRAYRCHVQGAALHRCGAGHVGV